MSIDKSSIVTVNDLIAKLNEIVTQHNGLVQKVDELCEAVNAINAAVFEITGTRHKNLTLRLVRSILRTWRFYEIISDFSGILLVTQNTPNADFTQYIIEETSMEIPQQAIDLVKQFEGTRLTSYKDSAGFRTVGVGHKNMTPPPCPDCVTTITQDQADNYLQNDLNHTADGVLKLVTVPLTDEQLSALISFAFNLGLHSLQNSTLLKELNSGNYSAAAQQFLQWNHSGGIVVAGLERRRQAEHDLFMKGDSSVATK